MVLIIFIFLYFLILGYCLHVEGVLARADLLVSVSLVTFITVVWVSLVRSFLGGVTPPPIVGKECIININYKYFCIMFECLISLYIFIKTYLRIYLIDFTTHSTQEGMGWAWSNMGPHSPGRSGYKGLKSPGKKKFFFSRRDEKKVFHPA